MEITDLTPAERRVRDAFPRGERVDFREDPDEDASDGIGWGPERTVRAEVITAFLLGGSSADGQVAGLNVRGARITGKLDLKYAVVEHAIRLRGCWFERKPLVYGAQLRALVLSDSALPGLTGTSVSIDVVLRMPCCKITGPVRLSGARIAGGLFLQRAVIGAPGPAEEAQEPPLQLNHADIGTDIIAMDLTVHGQTRINGATVGGQINLNGSRLLAPGGIALHAENLTVGTDLRGHRMEARGLVNLTGSRIPGQLYLGHSVFDNPGGVALRASSCVIGEVWLNRCDKIRGLVSMRRSQFDMLLVPPGTWPEKIRIDGLTYRTLAPHLPAEERLPALEREESGYLPYAYEQLTSAYRTVGDEASARTVQLAKLRRHRRTLPRHARFWGVLQDATVGYGFRPLRAAGWLLALLVTGTVAYGLHPPRELKPGEAPEFNPLFYTIDLMLPIIGFGQEAPFAPDGWYQWLSYLLIVTGWILATTTAAGVSRSLQRQ
ncbi:MULTISPECIES: membrane-associated oxidoreductase [unclassified Streptomyces]|uniref:membrane-associated oxidoreductase n=1 Tax=unclassified Streptomyces TaxID=2593676 RepID=UPI000DC76EBB|nr:MULTISPECIES: membrane-associated oxidoreductase [unclassified Streptomyces]AWZ10074.1 membrane-associated oxidoreductase [Streptomyces sp. ICC4]AWZ17729.1 membrane-associated oxidoreductase [Streptomyces sp. ICC1]